MSDTSKMTPAEYAAYTGKMSFPTGAAKADAVEAQACQAADLDYVRGFVRDLEDQDKRLVTEKPGDWKTYGAAGKAAILAVVREGLAAVLARAAVAGPYRPSFAELEYCFESGCQSVATHKYGKTPLCKKHFEDIPF